MYAKFVLTFGQTLLPVAAFAQVPSLNLHRQPIPGHPEGSLASEPAAALGQLVPHVGLRLAYASELVEIRTDSDELVATPLETRVLSDVFVNCGVGAGVTVGANLPVALYQSGDPLPPSVGDGEVPAHAIGDVGLMGKLSLFDGGASDGLGVAWRVDGTLPSGDPTSYLGDGQVTLGSQLLTDYTWQRFGVRAAFGGYWRPDGRVFVGEEFGSALTWGTSVVFRPHGHARSPSSLLATLDCRGEVALVEPFASRTASPSFLGATVRYAFDSWGIVVGPELPLSSAVGSAKYSVFAGVDWSPRALDQDGDGVTDDRDRCPEAAEDRDGIQDDDGCSDVDADEDGVLDDKDSCLPGPGRRSGAATVREDRDGFQDDDGCAEPDNDLDGVLDGEDECPTDAGKKGSARRGCPLRDKDKDGVDDALDKCRDSAEDKDDFQDEDGCVDSDNDGDEVVDGDDKCPNHAGEVRYPPSLAGCPFQDADKDTFDDSEDACREQPEEFNDKDDDDGCPDALPGEKLPPLVRVEERGAVRVAVFQHDPVVVIDEEQHAHLDRSSLPGLRALVQILTDNTNLQAVVVFRAAAANADAQARARQMSETVAQRLNEIARRADSAVAGNTTELDDIAAYAKAPVAVILRRRDGSAE